MGQLNFRQPCGSMKFLLVVVAIYGLLGRHHVVEPCSLEKVYKMLTDLIDDFDVFEDDTLNWQSNMTDRVTDDEADIYINQHNISVNAANITKNADNIDILQHNVTYNYNNISYNAEWIQDWLIPEVERMKYSDIPAL